MKRIKPEGESRFRTVQASKPVRKRIRDRGGSSSGLVGLSLHGWLQAS